MGIFDGIGKFITDNPIIKPLVNLGTNLYGGYQNSQNQDNYLNALKEAEQHNYDTAKANNDAYQNYLNASMAARNASRGASAAAARQNEANRVGAAKKGMKLQKKTFQEIEGLYKPYADVGAKTLPIMSDLYGQGAKNLTMLNAFMTDPTKLNQSVPAWQTNVPLPDWMKKKAG